MALKDLRVQYTGTVDDELGQYPRSTWEGVIQDGVRIRLTFVLTPEIVSRAIELARVMGHTHERDGELLMLLADCVPELTDHVVEMELLT